MASALTVVPPGLVLAALALAERAGAETALLYLFLLGIVVTASTGLVAFGCLIDAADDGGMPPFGRLRVALSAALVALFVAGAVGRSPAGLAFEAPGLASLVIDAALVVLTVQALACLVSAGERRDDVRLDGRRPALDVDVAERLDAGAVR